MSMEPLFDSAGNQLRTLQVSGPTVSMDRTNRLLWAIAKALEADLSGFDRCACGCERHHHRPKDEYHSDTHPGRYCWDDCRCGKFEDRR